MVSVEQWRDTLERYYPFLAFAAVYVAVMAVIGHQFYVSFSQFIAQDVAALHQSVWNFVNGNGLRNTLLQGHLLESRFSPIFYALAVPYAVVPDYHTLYLLNILFAVVGAFPVYKLFMERYGQVSGVAASVALLMHPYAFPVIAQGVRPLLFTMAFVPWVVYFLVEESPAGYVVGTLLCFSTHILSVLLVVPVSVWFYVRKQDLRTLVPVLLGGVWFFLVMTETVIPITPIGAGHYPYGDSVGDFIVGVLTHPLGFLQFVFVQNHLKVLWAVLIVAVLLFVPLFSTFVTTSAFYVAAMVATTRIYAVIHPLKQKTYAVLPLFLVSIYFGLPRTVRTAGRVLGWVSVAVPVEVTVRRVVLLVMATSLISSLAMSVAVLGVVSPDDNRYKYDQPMVVSERDRAAWDLIERIPEDAPVKTTYMYAVALSDREKIRLFPLTHLQSKQEITEPHYILIDTEVDWVPGPDVSRADIEAVIESENTVVVDRKQGLVLLREKAPQKGY